MEPTKYIWVNGELVPWENANTHMLTHSLHYGGGAFEGIRAYWGGNRSAIFRLEDHIQRLFYSSRVLNMEPPYTQEQLAQACCQVVSRNGMQEAYLRPIVFRGSGTLGINPSNSPIDVAIAGWIWRQYLPSEIVDVKISRWMRLHPESSVCDAKITGHYVNSIHAVLEVQGSKYHEALLLDHQGNVAEGPGENLFMVKGGKLFTPRKGAILCGITRATILELARRLGIPACETDISPKDLQGADEAFFTGTACEVGPIRSVDDQIIGTGSLGPVTRHLKELYSRVVHGQEPSYEHWLTWVDEPGNEKYAGPEEAPALAKAKAQGF